MTAMQAVEVADRQCNRRARGARQLPLYTHAVFAARERDR